MKTDEKNLLYKGFKVMPYCPRCETGLSSHEVAQGYKDVKDTSCIAKFKVKGQENKYILAWTTTPWTRSSNVALVVNRNFDYCEVKSGDELFILATALVDKVFGDRPHEIVRNPRERIEGLEYDQLMPFKVPEEKGFYIVHADYVSTSDGTGIVHTAPAYGEDDNMTGKKYGLPLLHLVDLQGRFVEEVTPLPVWM